MIAWITAKAPAVVTCFASIGVLANQELPINSNSAITVSLLIVIVGAAIKLTYDNTTIKNSTINSEEKIANLQSDLEKLETHLDKKISDHSKRLDKQFLSINSKIDVMYEDYIVRIHRKGD